MPFVVIGGDRVDLEPLAGTVVLRSRGAALRSLLDLCAQHGFEVLASDEGTGTVVVESAAKPVEQALRAARLTKRAQIAPAYHRAGGSSDDLLAPTGRVAVRFPEDWPRDRVDGALAGHGLQVTEAIPRMPNGYFTVTPDDPIEAARALLEEDGALFAEPDFFQRMRPGARASAPSVRPRASARTASSGRR
jgi:hypothetical protein